MENYNDRLHKGANSKIYEFARELRHITTEAEDLLWHQLRNRKLAGLKFRRQHALSRFIADFYCHEKGLVVEVDGNVHDVEEVKENDKAREDWFRELGLKIIRFSNQRITNDMRAVLQEIIVATR